MKPKFKQGDLVYLKSGSPRMTVVNVDSNRDHLTVAWCQYGGDGRMYMATLPAGAFRPNYTRP